MDSENTPFTLVHWWLDRQSGNLEDKQAIFGKILESEALRFHCMDPIFLAAYVMRSPWVRGLGHQETLWLMQKAVLKRERMREEGEEEAAARPEIPRSRALTCAASGHRVYDLQGRVDKRACQLLKDNVKVHCFLGLARGIPITLGLQKRVGGGGGPGSGGGEGMSTLGLYVGWSSGGMSRETAGLLPGEGKAALVMRVRFSVLPANKSMGFNWHAYEEDLTWGCHDLFQQPFHEALVDDGGWSCGDDNEEEGGFMMVQVRIQDKVAKASKPMVRISVPKADYA